MNAKNILVTVIGGGLALGALIGMLNKTMGAAVSDVQVERPDPAIDEADWQAPDGSFPNHGTCTYFGPRDGVRPIYTFADDFQAMRQRTADTNFVLAMMPQARRGGVFARASDPRRAPDVARPCNGIDDCIQRQADAAGVPLTHLTTDVEFLRRVRLDLTGRIPTRDEVLAFLASTSATKREDLVDRLLETPEWADRWAMFLGDLYRNTRVTGQVNRYPEGRDSFHLYLRNSMRQNKPYDQMVREMITAEGSSDGRVYPEQYTSYEHWKRTYDDWVGNPVTASAVGWPLTGRTVGGPVQDTYDSLAFFAARDFLGISLMDCVLCHDGAGHLDDLSLWGADAKRYEAWSLAAFFSDIPRYRDWRYPGKTLPLHPVTGVKAKARYYFIYDLEQGVERATGNGDTAGVYLARTSGGNRPDRFYKARSVEPSYPFGGNASVDPNLRLREQLSWHLTADPQFARAIVNFVWRQFFSRGIVEPPDQFDLFRLDPADPPPEGWEIQPSHPYLLELLAKGFAENGFDLKWLMRAITTSQTYQLSSRYEGAFNPLHEKYFVRHQAKRLTAEQMHDALTVASGRPVRYNLPGPLRRLQYAMQFPDVRELPPGNNRMARHTRLLLQAFTPGDRESSPRSGEGSPLQALNLMNNPFVLSRVNPEAESGTLAASLTMSDDALVANLYLTVLSRHPTNAELATAVQYIQGGDRNKRAGYLIWSLFNKTDFYFNY